MRLPAFKLFVLVLCLASLGAAPLVSRAACAIACDAESGLPAAAAAVPACCGGHQSEPAVPADEPLGCDSNCHPMPPMGVEKPAPPLESASARVVHLGAGPDLQPVVAVRADVGRQGLHGPPGCFIQSVRLRL